jgi:hypothetical protein
MHKAQKPKKATRNEWPSADVRPENTAGYMNSAIPIARMLTDEQAKMLK